MSGFLQRVRLACTAAICAAALLSACGGGSAQPEDTPLTVVAVTVSPASASIVPGISQQFIATATHSNGDTKDVTAMTAWTSETRGVATVGQATGLARAIAEGSSKVVAVYEGMVGTSVLTVTTPAVTEVHITPRRGSIAAGTIEQFYATATYADGVQRDVTAQAAWATLSPAVATIDAATGVARGVGTGYTGITAVFGGMTGNANLYVSAARLVSLRVSPLYSAPAIVELNFLSQTRQFVATGTFSDGTVQVITPSVSWSSSDTTVATVDKYGVATGLAPGIADITASFDGVSASGFIGVHAAASLVSLTLTPATPQLPVGVRIKVFAMGLYSDGDKIYTQGSVAFSSSAPAVATVDGAGNVTGVSAGTVVITATSPAGSASTTLTVTSATLVTMTVTPSSSRVPVPEYQRLAATGTFTDGSTADLTNTAVWTSSNDAVASAAANGARGLSPGTATITATQGQVSGSAALTVMPPLPAVTGALELRDLESLAVLAKTTLTNNANGTTLISGSIAAPLQINEPVQMLGFSNYHTGPALFVSLDALQKIIATGNSRPCTVTSALGVDLGGMVLTPGVYCYGGDIQITGSVTLKGAGAYIFRTASSLRTASNAKVTLAGGAKARYVSWLPAGATTLGTGTEFKGDILSIAGPITLSDGATLLEGRALSGGAVTLHNNLIRSPPVY